MVDEEVENTLREIRERVRKTTERKRTARSQLYQTPLTAPTSSRRRISDQNP